MNLLTRNGKIILSIEFYIRFCCFCDVPCTSVAKKARVQHACDGSNIGGIRNLPVGIYSGAPRRTAQLSYKLMGILI